jgi:tellurite resistance protein
MEALLVLFFVGLVIFVLIKVFRAKGKRKPLTNRRDHERSSRAAEGYSPYTRVSYQADASRSRRKPVDPDTVWVPANQPCEIAGYTISKGMVYVGEYLQSAGGYADPDPALINPRLKVDRMQPNSAGDGMTYWPSYSGIDPASRAAYLDWLSGDRSDPNTYIGYVFLYFYGLERRALADAINSGAAQSETDAIWGEVNRLLTIYRGNNSFRNYACELMEVLSLRHSSSHLYEQKPPLEHVGYQMPISVRVALGQLVVEGKPVPADWAVAWLKFHPEVRLRTPANRCSEEFRQLFGIRYAERYGEGLRITRNKTKLACEYRAASASFQGSVKVPLGDLPDVSILTGPRNKLVEIADQCADELEPFSRFVGRGGNDLQGLVAVALLPAALIGYAKSPGVSKLKEWIAQRAKGADVFQMPTTDLLGQWPGVIEDKLPARDATLLAQLLEKLGYGLEPDPRFGGPTLKRGEIAMLFRLDPDAPKTPSPQYTASAALAHLGMAVANADRRITESEREYLLSHIDSAMHLSNGEKKRLRVHFTWLFNSAPGFSGLKKKIERLSNQQKQALAAFSIGVAAADGRVEAEEIKTLIKLYPMLGLSANDVYVHLHALMSAPSDAPSQGPVTVQPSQPTVTGFAVPPLADEKGKMDEGVSLDMRAVLAKLKETAEVSQLLSTIFVEEQPTKLGPPQPNGERIGHLDAAHSQLLRTLVKKGEMSRAEFERSAAELGLLPDGAMGVINDAAFEACDRPICEGDDPICVDAEVAKEMVA